MEQLLRSSPKRRRLLRFSLLALFLALAVARAIVWFLPPSPLSTFTGPPWSCVHWTDGQTLITDNPDGTMTLWDAPTGSVRAILPDSGSQLHTMIEFFPHSPAIVTMSWDGTVKSWDAVTGQQLAILKGPTHPRGVTDDIELASDGRTVLYRVADNSAGDAALRVWDTVTGEERLALRGAKYLKRCWAFAPDGKTLLCWDRNGTAQGFDLATGTETNVPAWYRGPVHSVVRSPDGSKVVIIQVDRSATLWDLAGGKKLADLQTPTNQSVYFTFSPDSQMGVLCRADGTIQLWETTGGKSVTLKGTPGREGHVIAFAPNGKSFVVVTDLLPGVVVDLWDLTLGHEQAHLVKAMRNDWGTRAVFSPDSKILAVHHSTYPLLSPRKTRWIPERYYNPTLTVRTVLLDVSTGEELADLGKSTAVAFSRDGNGVVTYAEKGVVKFWSLPSRNLLLPMLTWSAVAVLLLGAGVWWHDERSHRKSATT